MQSSYYVYYIERDILGLQHTCCNKIFQPRYIKCHTSKWILSRVELHATISKLEYIAYNKVPITAFKVISS